MPSIANPTTLSIRFPYSDATGLDLQNVRVIEEVGLHTRLVLEFQGTPQYIGSTLMSGAPLRLQLGNESTTKTYYGYVDSVNRKARTPSFTETLGKTRGDVLTRVAGLGVSYPLKDTAQAIYDGPVSTTMERLIARHQLAAFVTPTTLSKTVLQAGRSDWTLLNDLAAMLGYGVCVRGVAVICAPYPELFRQFRDESPTLLRSSPTGFQHRGQIQRSVDDVNDNNARTDRWRTHVKVAGIDPRTGLVVQGDTGSGMFENLSSAVVRSTSDAQLQAQGQAIRDSLNLRLTTEGVGWQLAEAGGFVYIEDSGWWWVRRAEHQVQGDQYSMSLDLRSSVDLKFPAPPDPPVVNAYKTIPNRPPTLTPLRQTVKGVEDWSAGGKWVWL